MQIKIKKNFSINKSSKPLIIAEISGNHSGKKSFFLKHIRSAAKNGADMIKIQTYEPKDITLQNRDKKFKINSGTWKGKYLWDLYKKAHTPFSWHKDAFKLAKELKIILFSSPFSKRAVDLLEKFNVPLYKIASFEITDLDLIDYIAKKRKPIIVSTGMATLKEIKRAIKVIEKYHKKIIILYCVSGYPTQEKDVNISTINGFKKIFKNYLVGLSDHTDNIYSAFTATALGATIIEKHFILDKKLNSVDKSFSIDIKQLKELKKVTEKIFVSLGKPKIGPKKNEFESLKLRRSIFALKSISKGEKFSKQNIRSFRPFLGIGSENFNKILGKKSKKNIKLGSPIKKSDFV